MLDLTAMSNGYGDEDRQGSLIELRPMDVGDVLDGTIRVYRQNPWIFMGIMAVLLSIPLIINQGFWLHATNLLTAMAEIAAKGASPGGYSGDPMSDLLSLITPDFYVWFVIFLVASSAMFFLSPIAQGALVYSVSETILGRITSIADSIRYVMARARNVIVAYVIYGMILITITLVLYGIIGVVLFLLTMEVVKELGPILMISMGTVTITFFLVSLLIYFFVKFMFIPHAVVLDHLGPMEALKRSYGLTTGYWWRIFGIWFLVNLIVGIISGLLGQGVTVVTNAVSFLSSINDVIPIAIGSVLLTLITIVIQPLVIIATVMIYYDLRIRKEGFDILLLASSMIKSEPDAPVDFSQNISL